MHLSAWCSDGIDEMHGENLNFGQLLFCLKPPSKFIARLFEKRLRAIVKVTYGVLSNIICKNLCECIYLYTYME